MEKYAIVSCENLDLSQEPHHPTTGTKKIGIVSIIDLTTNQIIKQFEVRNFAAGVTTTSLILKLKLFKTK